MQSLLRLIKIVIIVLTTSSSVFSQNGWTSLGGNRFNRYVESLCVDAIRDKLYIGGDYKLINGIAYNGICQWDGAAISHMGCGVGGCSNIYCTGVRDMVIHQGNLYALFVADTIDCNVSHSVAAAGLCPGTGYSTGKS